MSISIDDYRFPTLEEREQALSDLPIIPSLNSQPPVIGNKINLIDLLKYQNATNWDSVLFNKRQKLREVYIYAHASLAKLTPDNSTFNIHLFHFDLYAETFYHFFSSSIEISLQVINNHFDLGLKDNQIYKDEVRTRLSNSDSYHSSGTLKILDGFLDEKVIKHAGEFRNKLTHRYPVNQVDHRITIQHKTADEIRYKWKNETGIPPEILLSNMKESFCLLDKYLNSLYKELNPNTD